MVKKKTREFDRHSFGIGKVTDFLEHFKREEQEPLIPPDREKPITTAEEFFASLKGVGFYDWNYKRHESKARGSEGRCCLNHILKMPRGKDGRPKKLYDYEEIVFKTLLERTGKETDKHVWIKKSTGLGITELMLRFMIWLATKDDELKGSHMCIVTGPNFKLARDMIK